VDEKLKNISKKATRSPADAAGPRDAPQIQKKSPTPTPATVTRVKHGESEGDGIDFVEQNTNV